MSCLKCKRCRSSNIEIFGPKESYAREMKCNNCGFDTSKKKEPEIIKIRKRP